MNSREQLAHKLAEMRNLQVGVWGDAIFLVDKDDEELSAAEYTAIALDLMEAAQKWEARVVRAGGELGSARSLLEKVSCSQHGTRAAGEAAQGRTGIRIQKVET